MMAIYMFPSNKWQIFWILKLSVVNYKSNKVLVWNTIQQPVKHFLKCYGDSVDELLNKHSLIIISLKMIYSYYIV